MSTEEKNTQYRLNKIKNEQFAILDSLYNEGVQSALYGFTYQFDYLPDPETVFIEFSCEFAQKDADKALPPFIILSVVCEVGIKGFDLAVEDGDVILPKSFAIHLLSIAAGVARGILYCKTQDTIYSKFMIPLTSFSRAVTADVRVSPIDGVE